MDQITLQQLLEAGCHFGHKSERWHPKANPNIYIEKDGIHIIDLAKTKAGLDVAIEFVKNLVAEGKEILFVGTKRQAQGVVKEEATAVGAPYFSVRWIGGFFTNWEEVKKNIEKVNRLTIEKETNAWKKFPKHERGKLARYLEKLKVDYGGVMRLTDVPGAIFVVDVKKEDTAVREATRVGIPIIGIVDTNSDPTGIDYVIAANDDAVGSIKLITHLIAQAYKEGKALLEKQNEQKSQESKEKKTEESKQETQKENSAEVVDAQEPAKAIAPQEETPKNSTTAKVTAGKKRGRPKKIEEKLKSQWPMKTNLKLLRPIKP